MHDNHFTVSGQRFQGSLVMTDSFYPLAQPRLRDVLDRQRLDIAKSINCVLIGRIESFNSALNTASVSIAQLRQYADETAPREFPLLTDCPVFTLHGGGSWISLPIASGDPCIVLFNDRDIDNWWFDGSVTTPASLRSHSLSDGMVLVGVRPRSSPLAVDNALVEIHGGAKKVLMSGVATEMDATTGKVTIKNTAQNLFTILNNFLTQMETVTTVTGAPAASIVVNPSFCTGPTSVVGVAKTALAALME
jgi:hypothetical protein